MSEEPSHPATYPPERILMGPGPSNVSSRVLGAMSRPLVGHLDPEFLRIMNEIQELLRRFFQTENRLTIPISGTGTAGMETAIVNFVESDDPVLVGAHGVFGLRLADMVSRAGGDCTLVQVPFGQPLDKMNSKKGKCQSWYLDLSLVQSYWGQNRAYHHTAPISMNYALLEALRMVAEEGLEERWDRHRRNHQALVAGIEGMGLKMYVAQPFRLWPLNTVAIPEGADDGAVRARLLEEFNLDIGGGLGDLKGRVWRVGLMGESSTPRNLLYFIHALGTCLKAQGIPCTPAAGLEAASAAAMCECMMVGKVGK